MSVRHQVTAQAPYSSIRKLLSVNTARRQNGRPLSSASSRSHPSVHVPYGEKLSAAEDTDDARSMLSISGEGIPNPRPIIIQPPRVSNLQKHDEALHEQHVSSWVLDVTKLQSKLRKKNTIPISTSVVRGSQAVSTEQSSSESRHAAEVVSPVSAPSYRSCCQDRWGSSRNSATSTSTASNQRRLKVSTAMQKQNRKKSRKKKTQSALTVTTSITSICYIYYDLYIQAYMYNTPVHACHRSYKCDMIFL